MDERIPKLTPMPAPPDREYRRAFTLRREIDRETGEIESRPAAQRRYREQGLQTPDAADAYYG